MDLHIEWTKVEEVKILHGRFYFVALVYKDGIIEDFSIAYRVLGGWKSNKHMEVPFKVTHVSSIRGVTHKLIPTSYAIGDKVEVTKTDCDYDKFSVGEIVGKFDLGQTWAIKMKDNFVILVNQKDFNHCSKGGG